jgi:tyrosine-protein kinase Etk/Wzc
MLTSRRAADETVRRLELTRVYGKATPQQARVELLSHVTVFTDRKANMVQLSVEDRVPARAQLIARTLGEVARALNMEIWSARSSEHRKGLEARLAEVSAALKDAEDAIRAFRERERVVDIAEQVRASVTEAAFLERMKTEKRIGLYYAQGFGGAESPEVRRSQLEAGGAQAALQGLVHRGSTGTRSGPLLALDDLPRLQEEHARLKRDVDVNAASYEILARQVEQLRAAEARPGGRAEPVDAPIVPQGRSRPSRLWLAIEGAFLGLLLGSVLAVWPRAWYILTRPKHPVASVGLPL